eukprot:3476799-Pyramimonas_sp.AAC.1
MDQDSYGAALAPALPRVARRDSLISNYIYSHRARSADSVRLGIRALSKLPSSTTKGFGKVDRRIVSVGVDVPS